VIQKATELGACEIVTFPTARCVSRPDEKSLKKKLERWQKIAASAAEQSGRGCIPEVIVLNSYTQALERAAHADMPIVFYENEHATTLQQALNSSPYKTVSILSGPEGGFEEDEVDRILDEFNRKACAVTLGKTILRTETAGMAALAMIMYEVEL
jgi:16S rRNA (uracil1498-N3)-methyltransferase